MRQVAHSELVVKFKKLAEQAERTPDGCLLWNATKPTRKGNRHAVVCLGAVKRDRSKNTVRCALVHHLAWEIDRGHKLPPRAKIGQICGNGTCIEPTHLYHAGQEKR